MAGDPLAHLRLLTVLDALLVTGSVTAAAAALQMSPAAVSRNLAQLRVMFADALMVRSGRGLVPTARAEGLRQRVRAVVFEARQLIFDAPAARRPANTAALSGPDIPRAPQTLTACMPLDGAPDLLDILARKTPLDCATPATQRLARHISTVGAAAGQMRALDRAEAEDAFSILFDGHAHPVQTGALLVAMQMRGLSSAELAGMVAAARRGFVPLGGDSPADLDVPAYLSPRNRRPAWFVLAARLIADAGYHVMLHGQQTALLPYAQLLGPLGIPMARSVADARRLVQSHKCAFLALPALHPQMAALMQTYQLFDMRSPLVLGRQLLNPLAAPATIMGLPSASQITLHQEAAALLGQPGLLCLDSHRDVAQATPHRLMRLSLTLNGQERHLVVPRSVPVQPEPIPAHLTSTDYALALWSGTLRDPGAQATVLDTVACALIAMGEAPLDMEAARSTAAQMWHGRSRQTL